MPALVDAVQAHREAVLYFGAVIYKHGSAVPTVNTGLLTSATAFFQQSGVEISGGSHVVSIESSLIGAVELDDKLIVDGVAYMNHGEVKGTDRAVKHFQVVPETV